MTSAILVVLVIGGVNHEAKIERLLDAIEKTETGGHPDPAHAVGDKGRSLGPYQLSFNYWRDATSQPDTPRARAQYRRDASDRETARRVVRAYWRRWCPSDLGTGNGERLARAHNGSGRWWSTEVKRRNSSAYWAKVKRAMRKGVN